MPYCSTIAIDGPVASGKTVVGRRVAAALAFRFLDSGAMYRAVTVAALRQSTPLSDDDALTACAAAADLSLGDGADGARVLLDGDDVTDELRTPAVEGAVSRVSEVAGLRSVLVARQRDVAAQGPIVMAGRDIGAVVLPDADVKVYLQAGVRQRAARRHAEQAAAGATTTVDDVEATLRARDEHDSGRAASPMRPADDAIIIDTDALSVEQVVERVLSLVAERSGNGG